MDCLFCNLDHEKYLYEDDSVFVVKDIKEDYDVHLLIIPKKHIESIAHLESEDKDLMGHMMLVAQKMGKDYEGYKLAINVGRKAGQVIDHIHMHLLSGNEK